MVCISFDIIDDLLALKEDEKFVVDVGPEEGDVEFGDNNQTTVTILDDDGTLWCTQLCQSTECSVAMNRARNTNIAMG